MLKNKKLLNFIKIKKLSKIKNVSNFAFTKSKTLLKLKATTRFELVIRVLQTHALPLGYVAM